MITNADDISVVLSGGTINLNPNLSLGGDPSSSPIIDNSLNNLFSDVSSDQTDSGIEDYRCIYLFNDGDTAVYDVGLWISDDFVDGATMQIGIESRNENQRITISGGVVTGGNFILSYQLQTITSNYNSDLSIWATLLQNSINNLTDDDSNQIFHNAVVAAQNVGTTIVFDIIFSGLDAKRNLDKFLLTENNLLPNPTIGIFLTTPQEGAPINTIASQINAATTPPGGVGFFAATETSPILLPVIYPNEGFPLWIKRTIPAGTVAKENDGLTIIFKSESLKPV